MCEQSELETVKQSAVRAFEEHDKTLQIAFKLTSAVSVAKTLREILEADSKKHGGNGDAKNFDPNTTLQKGGCKNG